MTPGEQEALPLESAALSACRCAGGRQGRLQGLTWPVCGSHWFPAPALRPHVLAAHGCFFGVGSVFEALRVAVWALTVHTNPNWPGQP